VSRWAAAPRTCVRAPASIQVPEGRRVIAPLSVAENLQLGRQAAGVRGSDAADLTACMPCFRC